MRHSVLVTSCLSIALSAVLLGTTAAAPAPQNAPAALTEFDRAHLRAADLVFVGEILDVGPAPAHATGHAVTARQPVRFAVKRVLAGRLALGEVAVHFVLAGGKTQDPDLEKNRLNPSLFATGKRLIVAANWLDATKSRLGEGEEKPYRYLLVDENDRLAPLEATDAMQEAVVRELGAK